MKTTSVLVEFFHTGDAALVLCLSGKERPLICGVDIFRTQTLVEGVATLLNHLASEVDSFKILVSYPNDIKIVTGLLKRVKGLGFPVEFTNAHFIRDAQICSIGLDVSPNCIGQTRIMASDVADGMVPMWIRMACIRATQLWAIVNHC